MNADAPKMVVDADACPVKLEISRLAVQFQVPAWMVSSYNHVIPDLPGVTNVQVDASDQSADLYIANRIVPGDVLITGDYGLATIGIAKRAFVLSPRGIVYSEANIDRLLEERHQSAKRRRAGIRTKGPRPFTEEDRSRFLHVLTKVLTSLQENDSS